MEQLSLISSSVLADRESILLGLRNDGDQPAYVTWVSIDGRPKQERPPTLVRPGEAENLGISIVGQGYKLQKGKRYEFRIGTTRKEYFYEPLVD